MSVSIYAQTPASSVWAELKAKREKLPGLHQEFEVSQTSKTATASQSSKRDVVIDISGEQWREKSLSGAGDFVRFFDGKNLFFFEEGGEEYERVKRQAKDEEPTPSPYRFSDPDWTKATEVQRTPCGFKDHDDTCVLLEIPLKKWARSKGNSITRRVDGNERVLLDLENGVLVLSHAMQVIQRADGSAYQTDTTYRMKRMMQGALRDASLLQLPSQDAKEVKELSRWDASKIRKKLAGNAAPELTVTDINGKPVSLDDYKGKTVLLDFWTTWCPPCRADGPALDKLYRKYAGQDLMIIGVSVNEDRPIVEKFLKEHPHSFPVVLTTENEIPRPYQIGVFPTYIVIGRDGKLDAAVQGDQGFGDLRNLLKKSGLDTD